MIRVHKCFSIIIFIGFTIFLFLFLSNQAKAETGCCQCLKSCNDGFADQASCINHCINNSDTYVNFYDGKSCSEYPACDIGACCDQKPECTQTTCLYCNSYWGGFLKGQPCSACPSTQCYSNKVNFDPEVGYMSNVPWTHCLPDIPEGCNVQSNNIDVRTQIWSWGWYPYVQDILASNTNVFNYSEGYVCSLTPDTHPDPNNFYTIVCSLQPNQIPWLLDDNCINFMMVTFGGIYYMDYSNLEVCCSTYLPPEINNIVFDYCISELCTSSIIVEAHDPEGGTLTYAYEPLDGGSIIGTGPDVHFDPPAISSGYPCPHHVKVTVTSDKTGLSASQTIGIYVKIAGDINGDGKVNATDKLLLRNKLGWSGTPGSVPEDINCDGNVNATDKLILRQKLGLSWGCVCP